ncbi:AAA family ATPase [Amycolatopsis sp. NPDC004079]|uniref:AAA family ATPase n=1 Tax=Amycolatopsis sp. NPDC004079 TaxID=3154549 RepID=UPI0033A87698
MRGRRSPARASGVDSRVHELRLRTVNDGDLALGRDFPRPPEDFASNSRTCGMSGAIGHEDTVLLVLRGPSASGKTTVAEALRASYGRGLALVQQDLLRRQVLRERDLPGASNIGLIDQTARFALDAGYHVVVEGILRSDHYGTMLRRLVDDHRGRTVVVYLDVSFEETRVRHAGRPQAREFTDEDMRGWYRPDDRLNLPGEHVVHASAPAADTLRLLLRCLAASGRHHPRE